MTEIKICGLTREADVEAACDLGAAWIGFNFSAESPRRVTTDQVRRLAASVSDGARKVGVFVGEGYNEIQDAVSAASLDVVQIHRTLRADDLVRISTRVLAVAHAGREEEIPPGTLLDRCAGILFDTDVAGLVGGTGVPFDWALLGGRTWPVPLFVSGGLRPENVEESIRRTRPDVVDVASGVESAPGVKDPDRMREFFDAVRRADAGASLR